MGHCFSIRDGFNLDISASASSVTVHHCVVVLRGFIANRRELETTFGFASGDATDDEMVAHAYLKWGEDIQRHIHGEFALAIIDQRTKTVVLTHDGLGLRRLYYGVSSDGHLHVATLAGEIARRCDDDRLDETFLADYLINARHSGERTAYTAAKRVPPEQTIVWRPEKPVRRLTSWSLNNAKAVRYKNQTEYNDNFVSLLGDAIRVRLQGKTWAELSGGLDSSSIISLIAYQEIAGIEAVSYIYSKSRTADEIRWMKEVINQYPMPWHRIDLDEHYPFSVLPQTPLDAPVRAQIMWGQLSALNNLLSSKKVDVLLSGFGGDQILAGDAVAPFEPVDMLLNGNIITAMRKLADWKKADRNRRPLRYYLESMIFTPLQEAFFPSESTTVSTREDCPWVSDRLFAMREASSSPDTHRFSRNGLEFRAFRERVVGAASSARELWNPLILGCDIRYPLLHRPLVEFMAGLPPEQRICPGSDRRLQRVVLTGILPHETANRTDKAGPDESIIRGLANADSLRNRLVVNSKLISHGLVDRNVWQTAVEQATLGRVPSLHRFLTAAGVELWLQSKQSTHTERQ